jgi:glyoxylase-like metal-dependent hydrolase (beta-lactamase superfamily II)
LLSPTKTLGYNDPSMNSLRIFDLYWMGRPRSIASALLVSGNSRVLIDPGPTTTLETLRHELGSHGMKFQDLEAILLTHIHLDHAGAAGSLVRENPSLAVYVHEKGAGHMADPTKLLSSATRLYGDNMDMLYGDFLSVPRENLRVLRGGETLQFGDRALKVLYTPGHASHHVTYWDAGERIAFVGDTAGICVEGDAFILPAVPPPDIDIPAWNQSLDAISALKPSRMFLTHFGFSGDPAGHIARYRERLDAWVALTRRLLRESPDDASAAQSFVEETSAEIRRAHTGEEAEHYVFNGGLRFSWLGLARYIRKFEEGQ